MHWIYAHLIGDYLLQTDWMAQNKKNGGWSGHLACMVHMLVYMLPFIFCNIESWQIVLIGIQHFISDRGTFVGWFCKITGRKGFVAKDSPLFPWSWILMDNILHVLWIAFVVWIPSNGFF